MHVIGAGFGGWIAAEMAVRCTRDMRSLVLVDALGIKVGDRLHADIADMFVMRPDEFLGCAGTTRRRRPLMPLPDPSHDEATLTLLLENRQYGGAGRLEPVHAQPQAAGRLQRIDRPSLVVWGDSDGWSHPTTAAPLPRRYPRRAFETIPAAGHYPYLEQPDAFAAVVEAFLDAHA